MFEKEAEERAKDIYIHHFDDDINYPCVLKAIAVGVQKGAEIATKELQEENARLKKEKEQLNFLLLSKPKSPTTIIVDEIDTAVKISKAKKIIRKLLDFIYGLGNFRGGLFDKAEEFLKECE